MKIGKYLIILGAIVLLVWFYSSFWPKVSAEISEVDSYNFSQAGYSDGRYVSSYSGGRMKLSIVNYSYTVDEQVFKGKGISNLKRLNNGKYETISVRYFPFFHAFSFSSRGTLLLFGLSLLLLGIGVRQVRLWALRWLNAKH